MPRHSAVQRSIPAKTVTLPSVSVKVAVASAPHIRSGATITIVPACGDGELVLAAATGKAAYVPAASAGHDLWSANALMTQAGPDFPIALSREDGVHQQLANLGHQFLSRSAPWDPALADRADADVVDQRRRNWTAPGSTLRLPAPHHTAGRWKAKRCASLVSTSRRPKSGPSPGARFFRPAVRCRRSRWQPRLQTPFLLVLNVHLPTLEHGLAATQETIPPMG